MASTLTDMLYGDFRNWSEPELLPKTKLQRAREYLREASKRHPEWIVRRVNCKPLTNI